MTHLERIKANFGSWLAGAGEVEILLLLDSIAEELAARGRPFPVEIPCFGASASHQNSSIAPGGRETSGGHTEPSRPSAAPDTRFAA